jgi:hypothetical protein
MQVGFAPTEHTWDILCQEALRRQEEKSAEASNALVTCVLTHTAPHHGGGRAKGWGQQSYELRRLTRYDRVLGRRGAAG